MCRFTQITCPGFHMSNSAVGIFALLIASLAVTPVHAQGRNSGPSQCTSVYAPTVYSVEYGYRPLSGLESRLRGMADLYRGVGEYNQRNAQAVETLQKARTIALDNELKFRDYQRETMEQNRAARQAERDQEKAEQAQRRVQRIRDRLARNI